MWLIGSITIFRAALLVIVQVLGGIVAAALVSVLFSGGLNVSTTLSATTTIAQGFFIEMILTAQLVFTIFMLAAEKHAGTFIAPVGIGLALFIAELTGNPPPPHMFLAKIWLRRLLDRRLPQPSPLPRPLHRSQILPRIPLDILAWTIRRSGSGSSDV
jgi:glycerol uptake facilitator-like aquaporin